MVLPPFALDHSFPLKFPHWPTGLLWDDTMTRFNQRNRSQSAGKNDDFSLLIEIPMGGDRPPPIAKNKSG